MAPRCDVLISYRAFSRRVSTVRSNLAVLEHGLGPAAIVGVDSHYTSGTDTAAFLLHLARPRATPRVLRQLARQVVASGGRSVELDALPPAERRRLRRRILPRHAVVRRDLSSLVAAVDALGSDPEVSLRREPPPPPVVVRFRRGVEWVPGRLCRLAEDGFTVATTAAPRVGDRTEVELDTPRGGIRLAAVTTSVTMPVQAQKLGATGFSARFDADDELRRAHTRKVLGWARGVIDRAAPPPRRSEARFPLRWSSHLIWEQRDISVTLRDVSPCGLFIETSARPPVGTAVQLRIPFDQREVPIRIRGTVRRLVDPAIAGAVGCPLGLGVRVDSEQAVDADRFLAFVSRVASRSDRRIVIGARGPRLESLMSQFAAVGYLTTGASDPRALYRQVVGGAPPELVLLDCSLEESGASALKHRLGRNDLPHLDVDSTPADARRLVDAALIGC